jgi:hypothetical protein
MEVTSVSFAFQIAAGLARSIGLPAVLLLVGVIGAAVAAKPFIWPAIKDWFGR